MWPSLNARSRTQLHPRSPLSVGTPGDKRSGPVENRFRDILKKRRAESEAESMDETLSETGEEMEVGNTP